jgi:alpha-glucosidase
MPTMFSRSDRTLRIVLGLTVALLLAVPARAEAERRGQGSRRSQRVVALEPVTCASPGGRVRLVLPFTRCLAGAADYTTMHFGERRRDSTWAHQIASMVVFSGPLLTIAANPQSILENPAADVIKDVPAVWDETIVLPGSEIGELTAYARRSGGRWFVAAMCGPEPRRLEVPLSFLGDGEHEATLVRDDPKDDAAVTIETGSRTRADTLTIELRAGGGFVGRFRSR